jgi:hypothetical protein
MDASSKFNSQETDLKATVPLVSNVENPPPLFSVVTSASALTKIALLVSSNKSVPLPRSESPRPKMAVPRDSATLNSRRSMTPREQLISLTVKTLTDVMSDSTYQPTEVAVAVEEEVEIVADAVAVSEVVVEAVASAAAVVEATDSEAAAAETSAATEEAVAASEEAVMATEVTDHLTAVTVTEEEAAHTEEVIANAALVVIAAVTDVADSEADVASEVIVVEEAAIEEVVEVVSNGIE